MEHGILYYGELISAILLGVKAILFLCAEILFRPKALKKYSFSQKIKMTLLPTKGGLLIIHPEDLRSLKWYRYAWMAILVLLILRLTNGILLWVIGIYYPEWL